MQVVCVYLWVSIEEQDFVWQEVIVVGVWVVGFYVVVVYCEKVLGVWLDWLELLWMVVDLQLGEVVVVEKIDWISCLLLFEVELLVVMIRGKGV